MAYDFKAARKRREELVSMHRRLKRLQDSDGSWDWWLQKEIIELDLEIELEHRNAEKTVGQDGLSEMHLKNILTSIVPQWSSQSKNPNIEEKMNP